MRVGILALQGAIEPHAKKIAQLGAEPIEVRRPEHLEKLSGIILPGGESTTMLHLLDRQELWNPLQRFVREYPAWGVCAGAILLARRVSGPTQKSLEAIDIAVVRNAFGRQVDSFIGEVEPTGNWKGTSPVEAVFIRAPRITNVQGDAKILFNWHNEPVMVEEGNCLAATFHPELSSSDELHAYFLNKCRAHSA